MIFGRELSIPANTQPGAPAVIELPVSAGVVRQGWVRWHWGSAGLCGVRVRYAGFVLWPLSLDGWFLSSTHILDFTERHVLNLDPYTMTIEGYNLDDTYPHSVWVAFNVMREGESVDTAEFIASLRGE